MTRICAIPGDGIGRELIPQAVRVLGIMAPDIPVYRCEMGLGAYRETGSFLPVETQQCIKQADAVLFGAITSPPADIKDYRSPLLFIRREFGLYANVRPVRRLLPDGPDIDAVIVRENTEGLYSGVEHVDGEEGGRRFVTERILTDRGMERIIRFAIDYARQNGRTGITLGHKANVLRKSDAAFREMFYEMVEGSGLDASDMYIDALAHDLVMHPERFDVILTLNMYGDIISDVAAAVGGGLGLAPSANIGEDKALFEPVHGSAPDIAGKGTANPTASLLSAAMLLDYIGRRKEGRLLEGVIKNVISEGHGTEDIGGTDSTEEFVDRVIDSVKRKN